MMNLRISTTLLSLIASAFGGVATAQTTPNGGAPTTAPAASSPSTAPADPAPKTVAKTADKAKPKRMTRQQEIDKSIDRGTVPARYRSSVPKEYQQYIPFDKK
jgi:hypothetical protein